MPKISKTRIINLNYNDNKRTIYDEIFNYGNGNNTLFSMDNGIGKTVLIQFFIQPFIRNKRELAGRKLEDYFSGSSPTYIMHEMLLDNSDKLLVGMIIKKDINDEDKNKLKILSFLHKYDKANDFDINNIPFVEKNTGGKTIVRFSEAEQRIKTYKKGKLNFKYFNLNDSSKKSQYFEELSNYNIHYKEWEDIIRSINNDESGLSHFYDKHKNDEALVKNVIIPIIESKLNSDKDIIGSIKENLKKYVESYKESKESLDEIDILKNFSSELKPVIDELISGSKQEHEQKEVFKKLCNISFCCEEEINIKNNEKIECENLREELKEELRIVELEQNSLDYYRYEGEEYSLNEKLSLQDQTRCTKKDELSNLNKEKFIQEAAELYEEVLIEEKKLNEVRERISNYEKNDSEIAINIRNYKFNLNRLYNNEYNEKKSKEEYTLKNIDLIEEKIEENENDIKNTNSELYKVFESKAEYKSEINRFKDFENKFKTKYTDFDYIMNPLLEEYNPKDIEEYRDLIDKNYETTSNLIESLEKEKIDTESIKEEIQLKISDIVEEITETAILSERYQNDLDNFNKESKDIREILEMNSFSKDIAANKAKLLDKVISELNKLQERRISLDEELREYTDTIKKYKTGLIELPKDIINAFEDKGIRFDYALNFLQNYKGNLEEKIQLIKNNPLFPYGIILHKEDIDILKNESLDVYSSIPIPIINRNEINRAIENKVENEIISINNQEFLISFNNLLIDEHELNSILNNLEDKVRETKESIKNVDEAISRNNKYKFTIEKYPYNGDEDIELQLKIKNTIETIENLNVEKYQLDENLKNCSEKIRSIESSLSENNKALIKIQDKKQDFEEFIKIYYSYKEANQKLSEINREENKINNKLLELKEIQKSLAKNLQDIKTSLRDLEREIKEIKSKLSLYESAIEGEFLELDINTLEARLQGCESQLGESIQKDRLEEKSLLDNIENKNRKINRAVKDGNLEEEYKSTKFSEEKLDNIKVLIKKLESEIETLTIEINNIEKNITSVNKDKLSSLKEIKKLDFDFPIAKEDIRNTDFVFRKNKINKDINENEEIIKEYESYISKLRVIKYKLQRFNEERLREADFKFDFNNLNIIENIIGEYEELERKLNNLEASICSSIEKLFERYRDKHRLIKDRLLDFRNKSKKIENYTDMENLKEVIDRRSNVLEIQLRSIKDEEEVIIDEIVRYCNNVLQELESIDKGSSINHLGKTQRLLTIDIPKKSEEESLKQFIKSKIYYYSDLEDDFTKELDADIKTSELLSKLIGNLSRVKVEIKKVEKTRLVTKTWKETLSQNSGGEKFVSIFVLLSSLMSYMRKGATDITTKEDKKIIIMDNPFAKTTSAHLLEPMFQIANKYNMQLLCFSGISDSSVLNRFNKIYTAKIAHDRFRNKENLSFSGGDDNKVGNEVLELTDFTISTEQISLI